MAPNATQERNERMEAAHRLDPILDEEEQVESGLVRQEREHLVLMDWDPAVPITRQPEPVPSADTPAPARRSRKWVGVPHTWEDFGMIVLLGASGAAALICMMAIGRL